MSPGSPGQRSQAGEQVTVVRADDAGVHVYAHCEDDVYTHTTDSEEEITVSKVDIRLASSVENLTRHLLF